MLQGTATKARFPSFPLAAAFLLEGRKYPLSIDSIAGLKQSGNGFRKT